MTESKANFSDIYLSLNMDADSVISSERRNNQKHKINIITIWKL